MPFFNRFDRSKPSRVKRLEEMSYKHGWRQTIYNTVFDKFIGDWQYDKKTGKGVMITRKKDLYEGDFNNNYRHGSGVLAYFLPRYKVYMLAYRGDWKNGRMHGHGIRAYPDVGFYIGFFQSGKRHGYGQMHYNDGGCYDGDWAKDNRHGLGLWVRPDGNRYEGSWFEDKKHGSGRLYFLNVGQIQMGVWDMDSCVWSVIRNLPYRQAAAAPTLYPLPLNTLVNLEKICKDGPYSTTVQEEFYMTERFSDDDSLADSEEL